MLCLYNAVIFMLLYNTVAEVLANFINADKNIKEI